MGELLMEEVEAEYALIQGDESEEDTGKYEVTPVTLTNTITEDVTMMIKASYTIVTVIAMRSLRRSSDLTCVT